jgi:hypothetical protein
MISRRFALLALALGIAACGPRQGGDSPWSPAELESLFPAPAGWTAGPLRTDVFERGTGTDEVRYKLAVEYAGDAGKVVVEIESEQRAALDAVLPLHGYRGFAEDGTLAPLEGDGQRIRDALITNGLRPVTIRDRLGMVYEQSNAAGVVVIVGERGIVSYLCEHRECRDDLESFVEATDLDRIGAFARYDHILAESAE